MSDSATHSVTLWIERLRVGDDQAPHEIWRRFFERLVDLARQHLRNLPRKTAADEEDVALSALNSFFDGVQRQRFPQLQDRQDLWKILLVITARKATGLRRKLLAAKRDDQRRESPVGADSDQEWAWLEQTFSPEPSPEAAAIFAEEIEQRLAALPDDFFRQIVLWKLEGFTNREIADKLNTYEVKIERKLRTIRSLWREGSPGSSGETNGE